MDHTQELAAEVMLREDRALERGDASDPVLSAARGLAASPMFEDPPMWTSNYGGI